jgi:hypothetical protein
LGVIGAANGAYWALLEPSAEVLDEKADEQSTHIAAMAALQAIPTRLEDVWYNRDACSCLLGFLDARDFAALSQTSVAWSHSMLQEGIWHREFERKFGALPARSGPDEGLSARTLVRFRVCRCCSTGPEAVSTGTHHTAE